MILPHVCIYRSTELLRTEPHRIFLPFRHTQGVGIAGASPNNQAWGDARRLIELGPYRRYSGVPAVEGRELRASDRRRLFGSRPPAGLNRIGRGH